ncbi:MAG TPA: ABC transporter permease [Chloroflexia bacterium]|nr:ABC transporter permease [Chloroflexia bacterium]
MRNVITIAGKELRTYFVTPVAYVIVAFWLAALGVFYWQAVPNGNQLTLVPVFNVLPILLLLIAPALTMRLLAEEQRAGTLELLLTSPVQDWAVVLGKFLGALGLFLSMSALTLFYPILMVLFGGDPDWGPIWAGYVGLILMGMAFMAVGLFASALTNNQMVSSVIAFVILLIFFIMGVVSQNFGPGMADLLSKLSISDRFYDFPRGVIEWKSVVYYLTFTGVALFLTVQVVEARRYRA